MRHSSALFAKVMSCFGLLALLVFAAGSPARGQAVVLQFDDTDWLANRPAAFHHPAQSANNNGIGPDKDNAPPYLWD